MMAQLVRGQGKNSEGDIKMTRIGRQRRMS